MLAVVKGPVLKVGQSLPVCPDKRTISQFARTSRMGPKAAMDLNGQRKVFG
jgi:hypothetical protein